ncbi:helix-turn-helix transcriptional regulator [Streptomyces sp. NPDC048584]|uniref:helix-turn-helix transcriptional regulator n=1 Tax=Streptomyces sp. NPDC048584 TaxID=3365573 RepID=UPI003715D3B7
MTVENNGPLPGSGSNRVPLSRQRRGVLQYLRGQAAPVTAGALAKVCALHVNTVREHLDALVDDGLAVRERSAPAGRGRPAWRYRARSPQESPAREYAGLAAVLAARIARTSADPRGDALAAGEEWGRVLTSGREAAPDPREARERLLDLLGEIGFAPEADPESRRVRLPRCPFVETAREHPGVICGVHEGLARAALNSLGKTPQNIELLPFATPDACLLHLGTAEMENTGADVPGWDAPGPDAPRSDASGPDAFRSDASGSDAFRSDASGSDVPGPDALRSDASGSDALRSDASGSDAPGPDALRSDASGSDAPGPDALRSDASGSDALRSDAFGSDVLGPDAPGPQGADPQGADPHGADPRGAGPGEAR